MRELVEFVCRAGDLGGRGGFSGPGRALAGTRGHQRLQKSRPPEYQREVPVARSLSGDGFTLELKGRLDGLVATAEPPWVEEIKTVTAGWTGEVDPLHWAQGKLYAALLLDTLAAPRIEVRLTYYNLDSDHVTPFRLTFTRAELAAFFARVTGEYLDWLRVENDWLNQRNARVAAASFPFVGYRPGQRELAVAAYRACARGGRLFAEAPTGIGKTVSVLFPAAKALGEEKLAKVFYLTAKTSGRAVAEAGLDDLRRAGMKLRAVTLTAREKVCVRDGQPCDMATCPLALGYHDRVKPAVRALLERERMTREVVAEVAQAHHVCAFELALDAATWADVVIGDYNHLFDPAARLRRFFDEGGGEFAFLVDEAHNLPDRARAMFSAALHKADVLAVKRALGGALPAVARQLARLNRWFLDARAPLPAAVDDDSSASVSREAPTVRPVLEEFRREAERWLARNQPAPFRDDLLAFYFEVVAFLRVADGFDEDYVSLLEAPAGDVTVRLLCLDPARQLAAALEQGSAAVFFSATLSPLESFRAQLGGHKTDPLLQLASPFPPEHLAVLVENRIATTFKARGGSYDTVAESIAALVAARAGNYLVYFPSYAYLGEVLPRYEALRSADELLRQRPDMSEEERAGFLARFEAQTERTYVGFAVLGGVFGEAIDLVGERLCGAVIVGVGLPQLCLERNLIREHREQRGGDGFAHAYVVPGMNRVRQAAGRVIRSEADRGVVLLLDERYREARYRDLLPHWWRPRPVRGAAAIAAAAREFWELPAE
jgi:DNA excision repair protein ERCC-2